MLAAVAIRPDFLAIPGNQCQDYAADGDGSQHTPRIVAFLLAHCPETATAPLGRRMAVLVILLEAPMPWWRFCRPLPYHVATAPQDGNRGSVARGSSQ